MVVRVHEEDVTGAIERVAGRCAVSSRPRSASCRSQVVMVPNAGSIVVLPDKLEKERNKVKRSSPGLFGRLAKRTHRRTSSSRQAPQAIAAVMICDRGISIIQ